MATAHQHREDIPQPLLSIVRSWQRAFPVPVDRGRATRARESQSGIHTDTLSREGTNGIDQAARKYGQSDPKHFPRSAAATSVRCPGSSCPNRQQDVLFCLKEEVDTAGIRF